MFRCVTVASVILLQLDVIVSWAAFFFFQAEDGIRDLVRSRGLGDVYKRQQLINGFPAFQPFLPAKGELFCHGIKKGLYP